MKAYCSKRAYVSHIKWVNLIKVITHYKVSKSANNSAESNQEGLVGEKTGGQQLGGLQKIRKIKFTVSFPVSNILNIFQTINLKRKFENCWKTILWTYFTFSKA